MYEKAKQKKYAKDLLFISFHDDGVYLNEVKIIDKRASQQIELLKLIILEQTQAALTQSKKRGSTWYELSLAMETITGRDITEQYIRHQFMKYERR